VRSVLNLEGHVHKCGDFTFHVQGGRNFSRK
jgi:hypothetical protein